MIFGKTFNLRLITDEEEFYTYIKEVEEGQYIVYLSPYYYGSIEENERELHKNSEELLNFIFWQLSYGWELIF